MRKEWQDGGYRFKRKSVPRTERQKIRFCTFVFIWEQRARYRLSDLEHALLEVSQMSGIIIELHHDRVLRGRIPRVCTALGMGDGLQKLFDRKWDHFSVTSAAFCGWSHPKPACPKSGFQHPLQNSFKSLLAWLLETQARQCHRTNSCFTECWMGGRSLERCGQGWPARWALWGLEGAEATGGTGLVLKWHLKPRASMSELRLEHLFDPPDKSWVSRGIVSLQWHSCWGSLGTPEFLQIWFQWRFCLIDSPVKINKTVGLGKGFCWKGGSLLLQCVFGAGQSCSVCSAGYILPPHLSWLWKGTVGNTLSNLDLHHSISAPQRITKDKSTEHKIQKAGQEDHQLWVVPLWFWTFFWPVAWEGHLAIVKGGNFPALQLGCCLPLERHGSDRGAGAVQTRITNAEGTDGRHTSPLPECQPIKSSKESCKESKQGCYYSSWCIYIHDCLLFQLFILDPCTGSVLLAELCCLCNFCWCSFPDAFTVDNFIKQSWDANLLEGFS